MYGDFSRDTFVVGKHLTRVLMQQGRVLLDADWNEQTAILLHYLQSLAADLIGPHGGTGDSFKINRINENGRITNLDIGAGHYYVDGILCENDGGHDALALTYLTQDDYRRTDENGKIIALPDPPFLVYLDVWERSLSSVEDPTIREVALGRGVDTAARAKAVWQVKVWSNSERRAKQPAFPPDPKDIGSDKNWTNSWIPIWQPANRGMLQARSKQDVANTNPCITSPDSQYRRNENQLYRVEIHTPGPANTATFKWSRDNATVLFPIRTLNGATVTLDSLSRDNVESLEQNNWVEIVDDDIVLEGSANQLFQVEAAVDPVTMIVTLKLPNGAAQPHTYKKDDSRHPFLRRWDHQAGASNRGGLSLKGDGGATLKEDTWYTLEDGIQIQFQKAAADQQHQYRTGDYWIIPARTETGDVVWPSDANTPIAQPPHGVEHHYAPLAFVPDLTTEPTDLRRTIKRALNEA
ncbi:MAG: hypothetical protein H0X37_00055 [Herpetosiphonaceae bacterium]|nr:hypothetical protein [Herpetosiphonaceae bacterium]